jgi:hypothetical protein
MIAEGAVVYDQKVNTVFLYTRTGKEEIRSMVHAFGLVGRRALFREWSRTFIAEDIIASEVTKLHDFHGYLIGALCDRFFRFRHHKIESSLDGITWTISLDKEVDDCEIKNETLFYVSDETGGYTTDGITWLHLNGEGFPIVCHNYAYFDMDVYDATRVYKDGVYIGILEVLHNIFVPWRDYVVGFDEDVAYVIQELDCTTRNLPISVGKAVSDGEMIAITNGNTYMVTMDLVNFREIEQDQVRCISGRLVGLGDNGYTILHSPHAIERIVGRFHHSRNLLICFRRFDVPFSRYLDVEEFFW